MHPVMWLDGRTALVTGGGRGIGAAIARRLAGAGARLVVWGRTAAEVDGVAAEVGGRAMTCDLADRAATDAALARLDEEVGAVDILVNNAGIALSSPLGRTADADWDRVLEVNVTSAFRLCRALVPGMVERGWGRVVNMASNAGVSGYRYTAAYCASKHAMVGMTRALAIDLARTGVTINAVCPGWVETRMVEEAVARIAGATGRSEVDARAALADMSPQRRMLTADEVAAMVEYLCRDEAQAVHGQAMLIDGGQVLR
jgi:NAD(P)-dependent dehydrogenase (short-subunit alcohol dehydrogenase family)